jgi:hypothetical protein
LGELAPKSDKARARAAQTAIWALPRKNESPDVRAAAAFVAGNLQAKDAIAALKQTLAETKGATDADRQQLAAACRTALDKIYQRHKLTKDY